MKKRYPILFMSIVILMIIGACSSGDQFVFLLDENANGSSFDLQEGNLLEIELESNPTTGYKWELVDLDDSVLRQIGQPKFTADEEMPGSGGVELFTFKALSTGTTPLKLAYVSPSGDKNTPEKTFELDLTIRQ